MRHREVSQHRKGCKDKADPGRSPPVTVAKPSPEKAPDQRAGELDRYDPSDNVWPKPALFLQQRRRPASEGLIGEEVARHEQEEEPGPASQGRREQLEEGQAPGPRLARLRAPSLADGW